MNTLLSLAQAAPLLGCRDPRTARKRLAALGVPVLELGGRLLVDEADVLRARRAHSRPLGGNTLTRPGGVRLAPGERLWDSRPANQVGPRRANGRPRGTREVAPVRHDTTRRPLRPSPRASGRTEDA